MATLPTPRATSTVREIPNIETKPMQAVRRDVARCAEERQLPKISFAMRLGGTVARWRTSVWNFFSENFAPSRCL